MTTKQPEMNRHELAEKLLQWHASMNDPVYAVGSFYCSDKVYPDPKIVEDAISNLESELDQTLRMLNGAKVRARTAFGMTDDLRKFAGYKKSELHERKSELIALVGVLRQYLAFDHPQHVSGEK